MSARPSDFNDMARLKGPESIARLIAAARAPTRTEPEPLRRPTPPAETYPVSLTASMAPFQDRRKGATT